MQLALFSFLAFLPILTAFFLLVVANRPASQAMFVTYIVNAILAIVVWKVSLPQVAAATFQGLVLTLEIVYIVFGAILLLNIMQESGGISKIRERLIGISRDRRVQLIIIAWFLGSFIEGASGFGSAAVICVPLMVAIGFPAMAAVIAALIVQSTPSSFGAVGTPFIIGVNNGLEGNKAVIGEINRLGLSFSEYINLIGSKTALFQGVIGVFVPLVLVMMITANFGKAKSWKDGWSIAGFALFSGLAFTIPYVLTAIFLGPAFPSLLGSLVAMVIVIPATRAGFLIPKETWDFPDRSEWSPAWTGNINTEITPAPARITAVLAWAPYVLLGFFLYLSRSQAFPFRSWLESVQISFNNVFGTEISFNSQPLYLPATIFVLVAIITCFLHGVRVDQVQRAISGAGSAIVGTALAIGASVPMAMVFINSDGANPELASMPLTLADGVSRLSGSIWPLFAPVIGTVGSFVSGSVTVSNIMFSLMQFGVAKEIGASTALIVALQVVGAAAGNMIAISNIVPAVATVGLMGREGIVLRQVILPTLAYLIFAGVLGMIVVSQSSIS
ncbi:L-lactate permease [Gloeocapsa sp. PCC 73106]|uniref:L-lactate permease n=1 Tax=Gloeocapsa sp. PCC 73106 TaxID=102232 RepID=UPI0002AC06C8|nr:L-lactate permease [Gloeocapsa sp. PCC 73106]ELR97056.1 L-lactate permease [Gloeocapsa sp. PCC 73106]